MVTLFSSNFYTPLYEYTPSYPKGLIMFKKAVYFVSHQIAKVIVFILPRKKTRQLIDWMNEQIYKLDKRNENLKKK